MRRQHPVLFLLLSLVVGACEVFGLPPPAESCAGPARDYAGTVVGAFDGTVGAIRALEPRQAVLQRWPDLAADYPAVLCYIDGEVAKAPPPGPNGEVRPPFDRAVVAIVDGQSELIIAGYRDQLPVRASGPFERRCDGLIPRLFGGAISTQLDERSSDSPAARVPREQSPDERREPASPGTPAQGTESESEVALVTIAGMATRERPGDRGAQDARRIVRVTGAEFRERRLSLGASQAAVARAAGVSPAQEGRIERGEVRAPSLEQLCRIGRALGLAPSLRYLPTGAPVRDAGQLAVFGRFEVLLAPPLRLRREVGLPMPGDLRAWDGLIEGGAEVCFVEVEARLRDTQATARRIELKVRDDGRGRVVILVVARTAHNKAVLAEHREALRTQFPLDGPAITRSLRRGETPKASGMLVV